MVTAAALLAYPRLRYRAARQALDRRRDPRLGVWGAAQVARTDSWQAFCPICGWHGPSFEGSNWCESLACPACDSVARDRFLRHCWTSRTPYRASEHILETSPRLGGEARAHLRRVVQYQASDFDESLHRADLHLDLQDIDLPDASLDTILSAHVLEHVPEPDRALAEVRRVLRPGGHLFLQVPLLQARTAPPDGPEFHEDNTPVFWRFGWDLTDRCRAAGFETSVLVTADLRRCAADPDRSWADIEPVADFDVRDIASALPDPAELTSVADHRTARRLGFLPPYMYVTWQCRRPG